MSTIPTVTNPPQPVRLRGEAMVDDSQLTQAEALGLGRPLELGCPKCRDKDERIVELEAEVKRKTDALIAADAAAQKVIAELEQRARVAQNCADNFERYMIQAKQRATELEREVTALRKGAERYDWIRAHPLAAVYRIEHGPACPTPEDVDAAIDAAMKGVLQGPVV